MQYINLALYQKNHIYRINQPADDLYYLFDYDERPYRLNMEFQHFHSFYEIMIPLEVSAGHLIEGKYYDLQIHDFVLLSPSRLHKTQYHKGNPSKRIIINFRFLPAQFGFPETLTEILSPFSSEIPIYRFDSSHLKALTAIAEGCGFTSFSQFNRVFKKFCGIPPSAYRNHGEIIDLQTWEDKN